MKMENKWLVLSNFYQWNFILVSLTPHNIYRIEQRSCLNFLFVQTKGHMCSAVQICSRKVQEPFLRQWKYERPHDKTNKMTVHPVKTHISLGICPVRSESSLCAQWVANDPSFLHADSLDSDQTGRIPRLIWVFAGCTCHFAGFVMRQLNYNV